MRESIGTNMDNYDLHPASETEGFYEHILASWDPVHEDSNGNLRTISHSGFLALSFSISFFSHILTVFFYELLDFCRHMISFLGIFSFSDFFA